MKRLKFFLIITSACVVFLMGCKKKFEDYSQNKNLPLQVPPNLILLTVLNDLAVFPGGDVDKANQFIASNYTYYGLNQYWTGSASLNYGSLRNVLQMELAARKLNNGSDDNPYRALGLFLRAFFFVSMTEKVGDLPMRDALQGLDNPSPKYDTQKDIFKQCLVWLDSANTLLAGQIPFLKINASYFDFSGDFYFKQRISNPLSTPEALIKWQKVVNSFKLRVLIELSRHADDGDLDIKNQFSTIFNNSTQYPIFESNDDNLQYVYNTGYNYYPDNPNNYGNNAGRLNLGAKLETTLGELHDLRAMVLGEPARGLGFADTDYRSYVGANLGKDVSTLSTESQDGKLSLYNYNHFYTTLTGEPTLILSYPEICFDIAEAINRGWMDGDAETWYKKGTSAMFAFYGIKDGDNQVVLLKVDGSGGITYNVPFIFVDYFNQPLVKYKGNNPAGLAQILTQKYLAYARNSGLQAYYQWRRTGVPVFDAGPGTGNGGKIPLRYQYPSNEIASNASNLTSALQSQYGGTDDINAKMWLIR